VIVLYPNERLQFYFVINRLGKEARMAPGNEARIRGYVRWFDKTKGCGFIGRDNGSDVFVYFSDIVGDSAGMLREGDPVEFNIVKGLTGPQAANVTKTQNG
jgi:cold shock protein